MERSLWNLNSLVLALLIVADGGVLPLEECRNTVAHQTYIALECPVTGEVITQLDGAFGTLQGDCSSEGWMASCSDPDFLDRANEECLQTSYCVVDLSTTVCTANDVAIVMYDCETAVPNSEKFVEVFSAANPFDLSNSQLLFSQVEGGYSSCITTSITEFPVNSPNARTFPLRDDQSREIALPKPFTFYGVPYYSVFIGSNGYITFSEHDESFEVTLANHFATARISALFADFSPADSPGGVRIDFLLDRFVLTFENIYDYWYANSASFQVELFYDTGDIRITYLSVGLNGIVGLSDGGNHDSAVSQNLDDTQHCSYVDLCEALQCNHGTCVSGISEAVCDCASGWGGSDCSVAVAPLNVYYQEFQDGSFDLSQKSLIFSPSSPFDYTLCINDNILDFPVDPTNDTTIVHMIDDSTIWLLMDHPFVFYGITYDAVFVSSNGYLSFGVPASDTVIDYFFNWPRIGGLYTNLDPSTSGYVSLKGMSDRIVISFLEIPEYDEDDKKSSLQYELFYISNVIRITYQTVQASTAVVGLSNGLRPSPLNQMDISAAATCSLNGKSCGDYACVHGRCSSADNLLSCQCDPGWAGLHCDGPETVLLFQYFIRGSAPFDLVGTQLTFKPSATAYSLCKSTGFTNFNVTGGDAVTLLDDSYVEIPLNKPFSYFGTPYNVTYLGSNGYLVFEKGDVHYNHLEDHHLDRLRISGLFTDLDPSMGEVTVLQTEEYLAVTFSDVPLAWNDDAGTVTFQMQLVFATGEIVFTYLHVGQALESLVGISAAFSPTYYVMFDLSEAEYCSHDHGSACDAAPCVHGACIPDDATGGYSCICDIDWAGFNCDKGVVETTFEIYTGIQQSDGTNSAIQFVLHGSLGDSDIITPSSTGYAQQLLTVTMDVVDVGKVSSLTVTSTSQNDWFLEGVRLVTQTSLPLWFMYHDDIVSPSNPSATILPVSETQYKFHIVTATGKSASTTGHVFFSLSGGSSATQSMLVSPNGFTAGSTVDVTVAGPSIGALQKATLTIQSRDAWHLEWFSVTVGGTQYYFEYFDSLSTSVEISATSTPPEQVPVDMLLLPSLARQSITFTPLGDNSFDVCMVDNLIYFPHDTSEDTQVPLNNDDYAEVSLSKPFLFFGKSYSSVFIGSNGYLTFGKGDTSKEASLSNHFSMPRISAMLADMNPEAAGHVYQKELEDRFIVTYDDVTQKIPFDILDTNNDAQIELFFASGIVRISYLNFQVVNCVVGLSPGHEPTHTGSYDFPSAATCPANSLCQDNNCNGHGTCINLIDSYRCDCFVGYTGEYCEDEAVSCDDHPCLHGSCVQGDGSISCYCDFGWTGPTCAININDCATYPCIHGTCTDLVNDYSCSCEPGWTDKNCSTNIDDCEPQPCAHGQCIDGIDSFTCVCDPGWYSELCDSEEDYCANNECVHGECVSTPSNGSYTCSCDDGYSGKYCDVSDCGDDECVHGKCATQMGGNVCVCDAGWVGQNCDQVADECANVDCGNGKCTVSSSDNDDDDDDDAHEVVCTCDDGWTGEKCDTEDEKGDDGKDHDDGKGDDNHKSNTAAIAVAVVVVVVVVALIVAGWILFRRAKEGYRGRIRLGDDDDTIPLD